MKKPIFILSLLLLFLLSYFREVTFIGLNALIEGEEHNYANSELPNFLSTWTDHALIQLKWLLTGLYSLLFIALTYFGIRLALNRAAGIWVLAIYALLLFVTGISLLIGLVFLNFNTVYPAIRAIIGIIHSPILFLLISISFYAVGTLKK